MRTNNKKIIARVLCVVTAFVFLLSVLVNVDSVRAVASRSTNSYNNALSHQLTAMAMKKCIEAQGGFHITFGGPKRWDDVLNGDVFRQASNVDVGPWYKEAIYGEGIGDGSIECSGENSSIARVFAEQFQDVLGTSDVSAILCGENGASGLVTATVPGGMAAEGYCGDGNYNYEVKTDAALAYIESIYNQWLEQSEDAKDAVSWENLNKADFSDQELYQLLYNDLEKGCGGSSDTKSDGALEVKYIDSLGVTTTKYFNPSNPNKTSINTAYITDPVSCSEIANMLNDYADTYVDNLKNDQGKSCYDEMLSSGKFNNSTTFKSLEEASSNTRDSQGNQVYSMFTEQADNGEIKCKMVDGIETDIEESNNTLDPNFTYNTANNPEDDGPCFDGGVGALGWIICPIIKLLRQTTENLYDYVITPFLEIDMGAFNTDSAAFKGWQVFQSFANIIFVIFLLLIIFSQITGYGIDNYGIKRMLPKLIIAAILVNLSFIICQLLVDASNIIGYSVENLFNSLAGNTMMEAGSDPVGSGTAVGATIISGAVGIGGAVGAIATAELWLPVLILPLILGLISIIVSCLFVFIILGARRAAAIILVVIAPLAFVMYMLPNTKKLFDRWYSAFKAVLLVFPIIGLLMGGGAFAGAILWNVSSDASGGGFFLGQLLAALTTVIPFFFIPRILKSSLNAVGNLGTMLSNAGAGISRGLGGIAKMGVGNSNWYKNMQDHGKDVMAEKNRNREQARAQRIVDRMKARGGKDGENLTEAQRRRQYVAQATLNRLQREDVEAEAGMKSISRDVELAQAQAKRRQESVNAREDQIRLSGDVDNMDAMRSQLSAAIMDNDDVAIEAYQNVLSGKGEQGRQAVHDAMVNAEASGNVSAEARKAYASNIMNGKFANDYKNNSRSTFEYAKANAGSGSGGNMSSYYGTAVDSLTQQKMVDMDEAELNRYLAAAQDARKVMSDSSASQKARSDAEARLGTITSMASGALNNQRLAQGLKGSQRKVLEQIAGEAPAGDGPVLDVRDNGANRQYDAAMNRMAAENRRPKNNSNPVNQEGLDQYNDMNDGRV